MNGKPVTSARRLAAVVGKCFPMQKGATLDGLRHAAYSKALGREIASSKDMTDAEVRQLLTRWEHWQAPFCPSDAAKAEIAELAAAYQIERGQTEMAL